jgi:RimJ/RimL family protein N-acetyltransferase
LESIEGKLWVCGTSKLGYVGYCLIAQKNAKETEVLEILKLGITKKHQNNGYGKHIISFCMTLLPKNRKLYARCYPQSEPAYRMLMGCGFRHVNTTPGGTRELLFEPLN